MYQFSPEQKNSLKEKIDFGYNLREMKDLCHKMGVNWEEIGTGETPRNNFAQELVNYFERRNRLDELLYTVREERPRLFENTFDEDSEAQISGNNTGSKDDGSIFWIIAIALVIGLIYLFNSSPNPKKPDEFITSYINLLNNNNAQKAWEDLSGDYRVNKHPTGYEPYAEYYLPFRKVEVLRIEVLDETDTSASVRVFLALTNEDDSIINQDIIYYLSRSTPDDQWLIDDSNP